MLGCNRIIAHSPGENERIMFIAHSDVVKLMVTYIDEAGFLYVKPYGGIDVNILPCRCLTIKHNDNEVVGVIGKRPFHLQHSDSPAKLNWEDVWIDIGAKNKEEALSLVGIGDYAYFNANRVTLANNLLSDKYLDDSVGITVLTDVSESIKGLSVGYDLYFVASEYEEIGMRGAIIAANSIKPDICIAVDVTHATDYPGMNPIKDGNIKISDGCVLTVGSNIDDGLFQNLKSIAEQNHIKYQVEPSPYPTGTDANVVQISNTGVRTAVISIPCRYMHTPQEVVSEDDIKCAKQLIKLFISQNQI